MNTHPPVIYFTRSTALQELSDGINNVISKGCKSIILLTCIDNDYDEQQTNTLLRECSVPICGGMFPQIVMREKAYSQGAIILGLMFSAKIVNYNLLSTDNTDIRNYINKHSQPINNCQDFIILADAFCNTNEHFTDEFYDHMGSGITVVGGGCGALDFIPRPSIFSNQGLLSDAVQVIAIPVSINSQVGHGWEILDGPYLVTASDGHFVQSLNYMPAFDLYQNVIQNIFDQPLTEQHFFNIAKNFPLGIQALSGELIVRDPIQSNGSYLECVGNVPINSTVYLLKGDQQKMILETEKSAQRLAEQKKSKTLLVFDCISRGLFMGEDITFELQAIQQHFPESCLIGAMSLGEISNTQSGAIHILNKSTVLGSF